MQYELTIYHSVLLYYLIVWQQTNRFLSSQATRDNREDIVRYWLSKLPKYNKEKTLDRRDQKGYTAIHYAAKFNRFKIMTLLVTEGASESASNFVPR